MFAHLLDQLRPIVFANQSQKSSPPMPSLFDALAMSSIAHCLPAGYRVSSTHANPLGVKTNAPFSAVWDIIRCWVQDHPVKGHDADSYGELQASHGTNEVQLFACV